MDVIDVNTGQLQEVEIKGHYGVFTELRVDKSTIPEGVNCYELRHGDDDSYPAALEENVRINYFGTVLMTDKMELGEDGYVELAFDDFGFTGEDLTMLEYRANHGEEPEMFSTAAELVEFMDTHDMLFHLTEQEAEVLLNYLSGLLFVKFCESTFFTLFVPIIHKSLSIMQIPCTQFFKLFSMSRKQLYTQF